MAERYYTFDSTARRQLATKGLIEYYQEADNRQYYIALAKDIWNLLKTGCIGDAKPLPADVFSALAEILKRNDKFIQALTDHKVDVDRSFHKWPGFFCCSCGSL